MRKLPGGISVTQQYTSALFLDGQIVVFLDGQGGGGGTLTQLYKQQH
jgi:hypothetical protein